MAVKMTPSRPYLLKAYFDWLLDNDLTPHLVVNALETGVEVPQEFVQNGQIVLNIDPSAVVAFHMDLSAVSFNARFGGVPRELYIPMAAVLAIYARETGAGTVFEPEPGYDELSDKDADLASGPVSLGVVSESSETSEHDEDQQHSQTAEEKKQVKKPTLRVIK